MRIRNGIVAATLLLGCATLAHAQSSTDSADTNQCFSYGARLGSDIYVQCRLRLQEMHLQQQEADSMAAAQAQAAGGARRAAVVGIRNTNCSTRTVGTQLLIHCN